MKIKLKSGLVIERTIDKNGDMCIMPFNRVCPDIAIMYSYKKQEFMMCLNIEARMDIIGARDLKKQLNKSIKAVKEANEWMAVINGNNN